MAPSKCVIFKFSSDFRRYFSKHLRRELYKMVIKEDGFYLGNAKWIINQKSYWIYFFEQLQCSLMEIDCAFSCSCFIDKWILTCLRMKYKARVYCEIVLEEWKNCLRFSMNSIWETICVWHLSFPIHIFFELQQCEHAPFLLQTHHVFCERCITNFFYRKRNYFLVLILDNCWIIMNITSFYYDTIGTTMMLFTVLQIQFHYVKE